MHATISNHSVELVEASMSRGTDLPVRFRDVLCGDVMVRFEVFKKGNKEVLHIRSFEVNANAPDENIRFIKAASELVTTVDELAAVLHLDTDHSRRFLHGKQRPSEAQWQLLTDQSVIRNLRQDADCRCADSDKKSHPTEEVYELTRSCFELSNKLSQQLARLELLVHQ